MILNCNKLTSHGPVAPPTVHRDVTVGGGVGPLLKEGPTPGKYATASVAKTDDDAAANWSRDRAVRAWRAAETRIAALEQEVAAMHVQLETARAETRSAGDDVLKVVAIAREQISLRSGNADRLVALEREVQARRSNESTLRAHFDAHIKRIFAAFDAATNAAQASFSEQVRLVPLGARRPIQRRDAREHRVADGDSARRRERDAHDASHDRRNDARVRRGVRPPPSRALGAQGSGEARGRKRATSASTRTAARRAQKGLATARRASNSASKRCATTTRR